MRVGTSGGLVLAGAYNMDHPHACGDKCSLPLNNRLCSGSSPCVWGQGQLCLTACKLCRIIPMRVGTRLAKKSLDAYAEDHPHACGDKQYSYSDPLVAKGSSPCVWGQESHLTLYSSPLRIIPMRVGTS